MRRRLTDLLGTGLLVASLGAGSLGLGSCAAVYEDPIAGGAIGILPKWVQPGGYRDLKEKEKNDPWQGTAVVKRDIYPDGTVVFIIDAEKVGKFVPWDYTDAFLDSSKYRKEVKPLSQSSAVITYILLDKKLKEKRIGQDEISGYVDYIFELINLDSDKKEIEIDGISGYVDYTFKRFDERKFPKKGYRVNRKRHGEIVSSSMMDIEVSIEEGRKRFWIIENGEKYYVRDEGKR